ncbi:DUF4097 family beta strand repeat-containing protein [Siphonobacter curvatus]|uniref:Adhesin domain-containing protein n=1 Tax=Siphonobacter curvatus TaxID=2094562 RepID=A0A2S7IIN5_9BACT|nr:hypothetical protein [Siphonobacter curvatus]PQA56136.1 hypothetical protein C5O19_17425 [Siphonobacter curvatus]
MKKGFIAGLILLSSSLFAQEKPSTQTYRTTFAGKKVVLRIEHANVTIQGTDGNEILVEAQGITPPPKEAEGLRPVGGGGTDNTGVNLSARTEGDVLNLTTSIRQDGISYVIRLPRRLNINWQSNNRYGFDDSELSINGIQGEIEVRTASTAINLKDISGPVIAYSSMGKINAQFSKVNQSKPISLSSGHESIDISLPADTKAQVALVTSMGNAFTDFDIKPLPDSLVIRPKAAARARAVAGVGVKGSAISINQQLAAADKVRELAAKQVTIVEDPISSEAISINYATEPGNASVFFPSEGTSGTRGIINAPGVSIRVHSSMGNIYLRKRK